MLQAEKECGESSRPVCSGRADAQVESHRTSSQSNRHTREGLPRPGEVGQVEASPAAPSLPLLQAPARVDAARLTSAPIHSALLLAAFSESQ